MTDTIDISGAIRKKLRKIAFLKYVILAAIVAAGAFPLIFLAPQAGSNLKAFAETALYSGLVAFGLSFLNDFVLKAEAKELASLDREEFAQSFARNFFLEHADSVITEATLQRLMSSNARKSTVVRSLASLITTDEGLRKTVERSYLEPLHRPPRFKSVVASSKFNDFNPRTGHYTWDCRQSMTTLVPVSEFRVFVCCDNDVAMMVESSTRATDFVVLLSSACSSYVEMREWIERDIELTVVTADSGKVQKGAVTKTIDISDLRKYPGCEGLKDSDGIFCRFIWSERISPAEIIFRFKTKLSLKEDPYFVWTVQDFAFVDLLEIDYSGIVPAVGRVSVVPYIRNSGCDIEHDEKLGRLCVRVGGLAGPGDGVVLIFRPGMQNG